MCIHYISLLLPRCYNLKSEFALDAMKKEIAMVGKGLKEVEEKVEKKFEEIKKILSDQVSKSEALFSLTFCLIILSFLNQRVDRLVNS